MNCIKPQLLELMKNGNNDSAYKVLMENFREVVSEIKNDPEYCIVVATLLIEANRFEEAFDVICIGLIEDNKNSELYLLLGIYYSERSINQALICYKQALFYCEKSDDRITILDYIKDAISKGANVRKISFLIDATNNDKNTDKCIDSIKATVPSDEYELIIVKTNLNRGICDADVQNDIFVINSDSLLAENAFFYLLLSLYSGANMGAVGGLTNKSGNIKTEQEVEIDTSDLSKAFEMVKEINAPMRNAYEKKAFLSKFAILISRDALSRVGGFDDELLGSTFEDVDLCVRINLEGLDVYLVYNSFIFNLGSFETPDEYTKNRNLDLLKSKWNCNPMYSSDARTELIGMINRDSDAHMEVLELGCALGSTLSRIKFLWPNANVHGVEYDEGIARIAGSINDVIRGDVETMHIPYDVEQFDYIICADVLEHLKDPEGALNRFLPYLKKDGCLIVSVPNVRYYAVCMMLMQYGRFDYADSGILDRTHLRFFTKATAEEMLENCGLEIIGTKRNYNGEKRKIEFIDQLKSCFDITDADELSVFQYYFLAKRKSVDLLEDEKKNRAEQFGTLIMITPKDFTRLSTLYPRLCKGIGYGPISFVGADEVRKLISENSLISDKVSFINENEIIPFDEVHSCIAFRMSGILRGRELPRGVTGWYYQQFLKMQYAFICKDEYYMVWDGDTIPCRDVVMFQEESGKPYLDLKFECHQEYFDTLEKILPGLHKAIERSFISEHMLIRADIMREMITEIESNEAIPGSRFWEKIINAIDPDKIQSSSFSEFETYGTFVAFRHSAAYKLRDWHSFRLGGEFFSIETICDRDFEWLAKDFGAISFEKGHTVRADIANLFDNPFYQEKLTPKQMLQAAQLEYKGGYKEVWADDLDKESANVSNGGFNLSDEIVVESRLKYLDRDTYKIYEKLGDDLSHKNINQAFLCYENAEYLCAEDSICASISKKKHDLLKTGKVLTNKVAIIVLSFNNTFFIQRCIESIYTNCNMDSILLIIFDNGSTDGTEHWLSEWGNDHDEALVILNDENLGFSGGNNAACQYVPEGYDIFYLNNDTRMPANALFWLRMGLYESENIGAVGAMQNYAYADQLEEVSFNIPEQYVEYGAKHNVPMDDALEEQTKLCGFAMLVKRAIYDEIGGFDEAFNPGFFEDDDLSFRIRKLGYKICVCHNSYIYHAGSQSFIKRSDISEMANNHRKIFTENGDLIRQFVLQ